MPPKKKKSPGQAGKFKPLKRPGPAKKTVEASSSSTANNNSGGRVGGRNSKSPPKERQSGAKKSSTSGGRGRGRGGRAGRGRGRGGGRGGRFVIPTGSAFFTGEAAKRSESHPGGIIDAPPQEVIEEVKVNAGTDGAVFMPGGGGPSSSRSSRATSRSAAANKDGDGEGEEIIVADMMDLDDDADDNDGGGKKKSVLDCPSSSQRLDDMPSLFDDENNGDDNSEMVDHSGLSNAYMYDSDSSVEERRARRRGNGNIGGGLRPTQLPFPLAPHQQTMYDCQQESTYGEEKKMSDTDTAATAAASSAISLSSKLSDPPLQSPFLDLDSVSDELKQMESNSWYLMKFPTRLPHLDNGSSSSNASKKKVNAIKREINEESVRPDNTVSSSNVDISVGSGEVGGSLTSSPQGYDDTLKDAAAGRYGRIVVRKSGKTELVIGGNDNGPEVRLLVHQGLQCGFRQEAVSIDPEECTFVSLGGVDNSLVVVPDI